MIFTFSFNDKSEYFLHMKYLTDYLAFKSYVIYIYNRFNETDLHFCESRNDVIWKICLLFKYIIFIHIWKKHVFSCCPIPHQILFCTVYQFKFIALLFSQEILPLRDFSAIKMPLCKIQYFISFEHQCNLISFLYLHFFQGKGCPNFPQLWEVGVSTIF